MSAPEKKTPSAPEDPVGRMAEELYLDMCARIYSGGAAEKPQPRAVAQMCFKLAEAFHAANYEFNPMAIAAREAKAKASVNLDSVQIDFGVATKPK